MTKFVFSCKNTSVVEVKMEKKIKEALRLLHCGIPVTDEYGYEHLALSSAARKIIREALELALKEREG